MSRELGLKADGEALERCQPVGQVTGQHSGVKGETTGEFFLLTTDQNEIMSANPEWHLRFFFGMSFLTMLKSCSVVGR